METAWINAGYLLGAVCFIIALKLMNSPRTARLGNLVAAIGMAVALGVTFFLPGFRPENLIWVGISAALGCVVGVAAARKVAMTAMPQMVALFNGLGGGAVALVALVEYLAAGAVGEALPPLPRATTVLSLIIGSISFTGSLVAYGKLQELLPSKPLTYRGHHVVNVGVMLAVAVLAVMLIGGLISVPTFLVLTALALAFGVMGVLPIGGADMPVVISLLNSFTGTAAGLAGFVLGNTALLIGGALVGASGLILTFQMCQAMNRPLSNVLFGAFGAHTEGAEAAHGAARSVKAYGVEDAAILLGNADSVIIVPGYGMAVAQAQHAVKELAKRLADQGSDVKFAVHPVAGRMPGHMNVLLAEADVPYEQLYDLDDINSEFADCDVALVIGANDVVNPAARHDKTSPIYGMPILDVDKARTCMVLKRSMNPGFAGIENELFYMDRTVMVFGNAKDTLTKIVGALERY
ncbi:MAG: NAD(P)(+) transhydrogenase (Re/Si-specific) subunit beta [Armatimonadota bacterium]